MQAREMRLPSSGIVEAFAASFARHWITSNMYESGKKRADRGAAGSRPARPARSARSARSARWGRRKSAWRDTWRELLLEAVAGML